MALNGPIILVEDDTDDQQIFQEILLKLNVLNVIRIFKTCVDAFVYLQTTIERPFLIFCDVNLPLMSGIEFKSEIDEDPLLRKKSIPFIFYSTSVNQQFVNEAYTQMTVQGFFKKEDNYEAMMRTLSCIIKYWENCVHPNSA